jgi:hypothetical protein
LVSPAILPASARQTLYIICYSGQNVEIQTLLFQILCLTIIIAYATHLPGRRAIL